MIRLDCALEPSLRVSLAQGQIPETSRSRDAIEGIRFVVGRRRLAYGDVSVANMTNDEGQTALHQFRILPAKKAQPVVTELDSIAEAAEAGFLLALLNNAGGAKQSGGVAVGQ